MTAGADGLALALEAIEATGWKAFPVQPNKKPYRGSHGFLDATDDPDELRAMWREGALPALAVPDGWVVVDLDSEGAMERWDGPVTKAQRTRRGRHLFYRTREPVRPAVAIDEGVDLRGPGSYVVLYENWWDKRARAEWAPDSVYEKGRLQRETLDVDDDTVWGEGERDLNLTRFAGTLFNAGLSGEALLAALWKWNLDHCDPPLAKSQVRKIARSSLNWDRDEPDTGPMPRITYVNRRRAQDAPPETGDDLLAKLGAEPLSAVSTDPPPDLLVPVPNYDYGFLDPREQTILFGMGGTGKGVVASDWIARLTRGEGGDGVRHRVLVVDFEGHREEWARRVRAFGGDMDAVLVVEPYSPRWLGRAGSIEAKAAELAALAESFGATYVVIDSIVSAIGGNDPADARSANVYSLAVQRIGRPTLSLAHITKAKDDDAVYPFGSVFWHNWARMTWSIVKADKETDDSPRVLKNRKASNRAEGMPVAVDWGWLRSGLPKALHYGAPPQTSIGSRVIDALTALGGSGKHGDIWRTVNADGGRPVSKAYISKALAEGDFIEDSALGWTLPSMPSIVNRPSTK